MHNTLLSLLKVSFKEYRERCVYKDKNEKMSFGELDETSAAIGAFVSGRMEELYPGDALRHPVLVMTGRNVHTPACYIGVARAGCFYAPGDASLPAKRLNDILSVIDAPMLICDRENEERVRSLDFSGEIFVMEDILDRGTDQEEAGRKLEGISEAITGSDPLYVIFTSGSTGKPKGVITAHQSLMCYLEAVSEVLGLDDSDVLGNQSPLDYIAAIRDIYLPHICGGHTFIIPENEFAMPALLFETLKREEITTLCWSAAGVEMAAKMGGFDLDIELPLKKVIFSGSVISGKYLGIWQEKLPGVDFINQYGPTEATASCTYYRVLKKADENTVLPIGRAYKNYNVFLLAGMEGEEEDKAVRLVTGSDEVGEICISGPALALGYYNNPEKSAESFIQNPLNNSYRELIYRTGDLGKYDEEGDLLFLGRIDRQIKHLGHRIELDEIELAAMKIEGVKDCCSMYRQDKELLYLFYEGDATAKDITILFRQTMPPFMVPRRIKQLDELPRLPNGKKDLGRIRELMLS